MDKQNGSTENDFQFDEKGREEVTAQVMASYNDGAIDAFLDTENKQFKKGIWKRNGTKGILLLFRFVLLVSSHGAKVLNKKRSITAPIQ